MPSATADPAGASKPGRRAAWWATLVVLAAAYFVAGKLGLMLARVHASATAVWPPTGIALAACLLLGLRVWPAILLGAFLVNLTTSGSWTGSTGIAIGNTLEAVVGCLLVDRFASGRAAFDRPRDVFRFALLAAMGSTLVSATLGVVTLELAGMAHWTELGPVWLTWWLGDLGGNLVVAPFILVWASGGGLRWESRKVLEGAALLVLLSAVTGAVFGGRLSLSSRNYPVDFLCIPAVLWAAFRFGPRGTATALLFLSAVALWGTLRNFGPFSREAQNETLLLLQVFLGVTSVTAFTVAAEVRERRRAAERLEAANRELDERKEEIATYHSLLTHDITNFAMALLGLVERLLLGADGPLSAKQEELLRRCNRQVLEMNRMSENARMLVRIREQGLPAGAEALNLRCVLNRSAELARDLHFDRHARFTVECPPDLEIAGTPLLENVFINLLDNAVRHTPKDSAPEVLVRATVEAGRLRIAIRGGTPPPPGRMARLFENVRGRRASGHGIGLALVREVLERTGAALATGTVLEEGIEVFEVGLTIPHFDDGHNPDRRGRGGSERALPTLAGSGGARDPGEHGGS